MNKAKYFTFLLFLLIGCANGLLAQENKAPEMAIMKFTAGYGNYGSAPLSDFAPSLSTPGADHFNFGIEFGLNHNNMVYGYTVGAAFAPKVEGNGFEMNRAGSTFGLGAGYLLLNKQKSKLYPNLNAGVGFYNLSLTENQNLSLMQVQNNFGRELNLYQISFMLDFSLNYDYYLNWTDKGGERGSYLIGAKAGYLYAFENDNWYYQGGKVTNAPNWGMQGWYAQLTFGLGSMKKSK